PTRFDKRRLVGGQASLPVPGEDGQAGMPVPRADCSGQLPLALAQCHLQGKDARMTATLHLLTSPDATTLTRHLLDLARACAQQNPGSVLWLTPTPRAAAEIRQLLSARHRNSVGIRLATFAELAAAILEDEAEQPAPLSAGQRRLIIEGII